MGESMYFQGEKTGDANIPRAGKKAGIFHAVSRDYRAMWPEVSRAVRLAHGVKKEILLGRVTGDERLLERRDDHFADGDDDHRSDEQCKAAYVAVHRKTDRV